VNYLIAVYLQNSRGIFTLGIWCFSGFSALVPLVIAALYWKRTTKTAAYASVLAAAVSWIWLFKNSGFGADRGYLFLSMMPVATMVATSAVTLIVVSMITRPLSKETLEKFFPTKSS